MLGFVDLLALSGVASYEMPDPFPASIAKWNAFVNTVDLKDLVKDLESYKAATGIPFSFPPRGALTDDPRIALVDNDYPCGVSLLAVVQRMPDDSDRVLASEWAVEIDAQGRVLHRWKTPIDLGVVGIRGNEIILRGTISTLLDPDQSRKPIPVLVAVDESGEFHFEKMPQDLHAEEEIKCPELPTVYANSAYLFCMKLHDLRDGSPRLVATQGPCT